MPHYSIQFPGKNIKLIYENLVTILFHAFPVGNVIQIAHHMAHLCRWWIVGGVCASCVQDAQLIEINNRTILMNVAITLMLHVKLINVK